MNIPVSKQCFFIATAILIVACGQQQPKKLPADTPIQPVYEDTDYNNTVFEGAYKRLKSGDTLSKSEIEGFSEDLATRSDFYKLLADFNKQHLFPGKYYTFEKAAEGNLADWLSYPTELDTIPSKIELVKKVDLVENDTTFIYYVLKFKTEPPHWAAKDGWMLGIVGPYFKGSHPYDWTTGTFSRFTKAKNMKPETEVKWTHQNIFRKSPE